MGSENDIDINGTGWQLSFNVAASFNPIQVGDVPLEEVRYRFRPDEDGDYIYFSVGGNSCELSITDSQEQGGRHGLAPRSR